MSPGSALPPVTDQAAQRATEILAARAAQQAAQQSATQAEAAQPTLQDAVTRASEAARQAGEAARQAAEAADQPVPPTPPAVPGAPVAVDVPGIGPVVPMTRQQVRALEQRGERLSSQLNSAQDRRDELVQELETVSSPTVRTGLEQRITFLDERLLSLEKEIAQNSMDRASIAARLGAMTEERPSGPPQSSAEEWAGPVMFFTLVPLALVAARNFWRRGSRPPVVPISPEADARFHQLEQAIDTVAVEIERVAEGQRFVTKLLREGQPVPDFTARQGAEAVPLRADRETGR